MGVSNDMLEREKQLNAREEALNRREAVLKQLQLGKSHNVAIAQAIASRTMEGGPQSRGMTVGKALNLLDEVPGGGRKAGDFRRHLLGDDYVDVEKLDEQQGNGAAPEIHVAGQRHMVSPASFELMTNGQLADYIRTTKQPYPLRRHNPSGVGLSSPSQRNDKQSEKHNYMRSQEMRALPWGGITERRRLMPLSFPSGVRPELHGSKKAMQQTFLAQNPMRDDVLQQSMALLAPASRRSTSAPPPGTATPGPPATAQSSSDFVTTSNSIYGAGKGFRWSSKPAPWGPRS